VRLTTPHADPTAQVAAILDRRLLSDAPFPIAVAFSGGGDSLALLLCADGWARRHGRELLVLTVDHGLQPQSAEWTARCARVAEDLGRPFAALKWSGSKPPRVRPADARAARHRLLADAAREAGARVLLMGHTADDVAEAGFMRESGSTTPSPREWSPSPAWPAGRDLFLLRPLLGQRRRDLRSWLAAQNQRWIDDPANEDPAYARSRARGALAKADGPGEHIDPVDAPDPGTVCLATAIQTDAWGGLHIDRARLQAAPSQAARPVVGAACLSASGQSRPPRSDRLARLVDRLQSSEAVEATLAGARITADGARVSFLREPGELKRAGVAPQPLPPGEALVWDGRFEIRATEPGLMVRPLTGHAARLPGDQRRRLAEAPAGVRGALPLIVGEGDGPACPLLAQVRGVGVRVLAFQRFQAACGLIVREPT
jgi:tRNA(Ile)-lysidine synthase